MDCLEISDKVPKIIDHYIPLLAPGLDVQDVGNRKIFTITVHGCVDSADYLMFTETWYVCRHCILQNNNAPYEVVIVRFTTCPVLLSKPASITKPHRSVLLEAQNKNK